MKVFRNFSGATVAVISFALSLAGPIAVLAATTPSFGAATTFAILASTYTNTAGGTTINGDLGYATGPAVIPTVNGTMHVGNSVYNQAGIDQSAALSNLNSQPCTFTFAPGAIDLSTDTTHGAVGMYTPGVYCTSGAASIGTGGITLNGVGTYIFRINGALTTVANSVVTLAGGSSACNAFWTPSAATTLGANSTFAGTVIDAAGITIGNAITWAGRALAFGGTVSTSATTITTPTCAVATPVVTPTPASTPIPTATPSSTVTPMPTATPVFTSTPTPSITPSPTPVPGLPNTGIGPDDKSGGSWDIIIPSVLFFALSSLYLARKRQIVSIERS